MRLVTPSPRQFRCHPSIPRPSLPLPTPFPHQATSRKSSNNRVFPPVRHQEAFPLLAAPSCRAEALRRRTLLLPALHTFRAGGRFFAANPVYSSGTQLKSRQLVAPTRPAIAISDGGNLWRRRITFRAVRPFFLMNFNLHARHFTRPGWTNAVQPKIIFHRLTKIGTQLTNRGASGPYL
jgi:hypothetical protein